MKTLVLSMISIAATVAAMTACTSEGDPIDNIDNGQPVEIKLNAGVITTKTPITSDEAGKLENDLANVHFYRIDGETPVWTTDNSTSFTGTIKKNKDIEFAEKQYYPANGDNTTVAGLFVGETITTPPALTTGVANVTITGAEDIICATPIDLGNRKNPSTTPLGFKHLLTQFKFIVKIDNVTIKDAISNIAIKVKEANTKASITLSDGSINTWTTQGVINGPTSLTAATGGVASGASEGIMLEPGLPSIKLAITGTGLPTEGLETTIKGSETSNTFEQGKAYEITLTFKAQEVSGTASVAQWETGKPAEGDVI